MDIFSKQDTIDLSDEALWAAAGYTEEEPPEAAEPEPGQAELAAPELDLPTDSSPGPAPAVADREAQWQQATVELTRHWPEADMPAMVRKMTEISARYGDPRLWQRQPGGLLREAALELYGPPQAQTQAAVRAAAEAGRRAGMAEAQARYEAKLGAAPGRPGAAVPPPVSEDEQLIRAMAASRSRGIF